jgi:hypothetical protein
LMAMVGGVVDAFCVTDPEGLEVPLGTGWGRSRGSVGADTAIGDHGQRGQGCAAAAGLDLDDGARRGRMMGEARSGAIFHVMDFVRSGGAAGLYWAVEVASVEEAVWLAGAGMAAGPQ